MQRIDARRRREDDRRRELRAPLHGVVGEPRAHGVEAERGRLREARRRPCVVPPSIAAACARGASASSRSIVRARGLARRRRPRAVFAPRTPTRACRNRRFSATTSSSVNGSGACPKAEREHALRLALVRDDRAPSGSRPPSSRERPQIRTPHEERTEHDATEHGLRLHPRELHGIGRRLALALAQIAAESTDKVRAGCNK